MAEARNAIAEQLASARKDLLDLTLRNPLLNYRPLKARGLELPNGSPGETFRLLVREKKPFTFAADPAVQRVQRAGDAVRTDRANPGTLATEATEDAPTDLIAPPTDATDPTPESAELSASRPCLHTLYGEAELDKRLLGTYYAARTYIEEHGTNVLYLALGMLSWTETDAPSAKVLRAPLILIPVNLSRQSAQSGFRLQYSEDEITENPSLYKRLETEFGIRLPEFPEQMEDWDPEEYLSQAAQAISVKPRWKLAAGERCLGFFSFGKFMMYKDLDVETWPEDKNPVDHPLLQSLLGDGFDEPPASIGDGEMVDEHLLPTDVHAVKDADSSQVIAIVDVKRGRNLVVQGPPGTGKSQTITNMIAELLHDGKRVLFVAEKGAALHVVKSRLDEVGLGPACLELHSHKANKKMVLDDLRRTWEMAPPEPPASVTDLAILKDYRDRLNAHSKRLHEPVGETGVTAFQALGQLVSLRGRLPADAPTIPLPGAWTAEEYAQKKALVGAFQSLLREAGRPVQHPFWGAGLTVLLPSDQESVRRILQKGRVTLTQLMDYVATMAQSYGLPDGLAQEDVRRLLQAAGELAASPVPDGAGLPFSAWIEHRADFQAMREAFESLAALHAQFDASLGAAAWGEPVSADVTALRHYGRRWWRAFNGEYHKARRHVGTILKKPAKFTNDAAIKLLEAIEQVQGHEAGLQTRDELARRVFGAHWRGAESDWRLLSDWTEYALALCADIAAGTKPEWIARMASAPGGKEAWREHADTLTRLLGEWDQTLAELKMKLAWSDPVRFPAGGTLGAQPFAELAGWMAEWERQLPTLPLLVHVNQMGERMQAQGLSELRPVAEGWEQAGDHLAHVFDHAWFQAVIERAYRESPELRDFAGPEHNHVVASFQQLDHWHTRLNQKEIAVKHWQGLPTPGAQGQVGVLRHEFQKMRRQMPIRKLLQESGRAIQSIKPVFMMSPMSVASYLAPGSVEFDAVIFDEASQVRPVDAYGSILRGRQIVVVGDRQQLPPSDFFKQLAAEDEGEVDHVATDVESILTLLSGRGLPERMLRWHYRSRHESLIAVSNAEFYANQLVVFPSPTISGERTGLAYHYIPDSAYDRGKSRANRKEAAAVAQAVLRHVKDHPGISLGVVAFSVAQMDAIAAELEVLRKQHPDTEQFFTTSGGDSFFVKNLENVQGDERDVIFISVGYGRDANGHLTMNFGPLNESGGERRLNVMISRARLRCEVFTNLLPDDIDLGKAPTRGVQAFKTFLQYAKTGRTAIDAPTGQEADSPFEEAVRDALILQGYRVEPQVGSAGFRIDMAVVDPDRPGRYVLGIECDGATYHRARSARDRDRLRQQVLEGLGWKLYRIWSTDWFRDPGRELRRLIEAIEAERAAGNAGTDAPCEAAGAAGTGEESGTSAALGAASEAASGQLDTAAMSQDQPDTPHPSHIAAGHKPAVDGVWPDTEDAAVTAYRTAELRLSLRGEELHAVPRARLAQWIVEVVRVESPVHVEEVYRRVASGAGVRRIGARIRSAMDLAVRVAARGPIVRRGDFLWIAGMEDPPIRDRGQAEAVSRKLEHIAPEEVCAAIKLVLLSTRGLEPEQLPQTVGRCFGIQRLGEDSRAVIEEALLTMMAEKQVAISGRYAIAVE